MDLSTRYLNIRLDSPLTLGASPLASDLDAIRRAEDDGASAIVLHSLFEEQITHDRRFVDRHLHGRPDTNPPQYYPPERADFALEPERYLEQIRRIKEAVALPVFASLNGTTPGPWLECARLIDQAGADGLELNTYALNMDGERDAEAIEQDAQEMVRLVRSHTQLPFAVKLSPFHTSLVHFAARLVHAGASGLVLFNRFFQPDIDLDELELRPQVHLSDPTELALRLRWLAILSARLDVPLAATGGVHSGMDALKAVAAGASSVQIVSEVLKHGTDRFRAMRRTMIEWLELRGYRSLEELRGSMNLSRCPSPGEYERVNYLHALHSWS
jgi:dihydroorotate dehydrogenase (fumarate)